MPAIPEQGLRTILGTPRINAIVSDRIFPHRAPQGAAFPFLLYSRTGSVPEHHMRGVSGLRAISFQIDGYARSYETMQNLREAVRQTIDGYRGGVPVNGDTVWFRHLFIENDADAFGEPQAAGDEPIFQFTIDLSGMVAETVPNRP